MVESKIVRILVPLLGIRIVGLLQILLCVFSLELCWLNEHKARLLLDSQEALVSRDFLRAEQNAFEVELEKLRREQKKLNKQIDMMMGFATRGGGWDKFVEYRRIGYMDFGDITVEELEQE